MLPVLQVVEMPEKTEIVVILFGFQYFYAVDRVIKICFQADIFFVKQDIE